MSTRRQFLVVTGAGLALAPLVALTQTAGEPARVGILTTGSLQPWELEALRRGLSELGWVEGRNLALEIRSSGGSFASLEALARELAKSVDVIVTATTPPTRAAIKATNRIPIVFSGVGDPVALGLVNSFARPGANVTGVTNLGGELTSKRLATLKEVIPSANRIAVIFHPEEPVVAIQRRDAEQASKVLGVTLEYFGVRTNRDLEKAFDAALKWRAQAIFRFAGQAHVTASRTVALALQYRLPTVMLTAKDVENGGLMSYWTDHADLYRRAASYVDKILKGTRPGDLPVEQPTKFEFVINLKTAKALGISIPQSILVRADRVIE